jgi:hypothetical protein
MTNERKVRTGYIGNKIDRSALRNIQLRGEVGRRSRESLRFRSTRQIQQAFGA